MPKECILKQITGLDTCNAESLGTWAMQACCSGSAIKLSSLELMALITNETRIGDIAQLVNVDACEAEDPRIVRLVNDLRGQRGIPIRTVDEGYLDDDEFRQLRRFNLKNLE